METKTLPAESKNSTVTVPKIIKIASVFMLAICFCKSASAQLEIHIQSYSCDENDYYLELGKSENLWIEDFSDSLAINHIKACKLKGKKLQINQTEKRPYCVNFSVTPKALGKTVITAKVKLENGQKIILAKEFEVVTLPELCLELSVSSPDHKFIWLKIREEGTGKEVSNDYEICMIDYALKNAAGAVKEQRVIGTDRWFFPSISLKELAAKFEVGDELIINTSLIHKKYRLIHHIEPTVLAIDKLWN